MTESVGRREGLPLRDIAVGSLLILILGWGYLEVSKLRDQVQELKTKVALLQNEEERHPLASKDDLWRVTARFDSWAQENFAAICTAGKGTYIPDNFCKFNDERGQMPFKTINWDEKK